ncbi:MAG: dTDP-4-dehydrorhamnose reductase [Candidatus Omnitrophica bacterium]|nr:dTDP-4-dehydrorhamnose reductase [Candidatus Omnitrophota bacterium]
MKVLVTGSSGMLGQVLSRKLQEDGATVVRTCRSGASGALAADLTDENAVKGLFGDGPYEAVYHTAAYSDVDGCERDPERARRANALATRSLAGYCSETGAVLVHVSTDYVFSGQKDSPYVETDPTGPVNIYGLTKLESEYHALHARIPSAVVRTSWLFGGPKETDFVNAIVRRLRSDRVVRVLDDQIDCPTSAEDLSTALTAIAEALLERRRRGADGAEVYHVCNTGATTRLEMARCIRDILGLGDASVERLSRQDIPGRLAVRPRRNVMSVERFEREFGRRLRPWQESLRDYLVSAPCAS